MVEIIIPVALFLTLGFVIVAITRVVSEGRTRRRLIEAGVTPELAAAIITPPAGDPALYVSLKWGLVVGAIGLALIVIQFLGFRIDEPIVAGVVMLFAAAGLLGYYASARRLSSAAR